MSRARDVRGVLAVEHFERNLKEKLTSCSTSERLKKKRREERRKSGLSSSKWERTGGRQKKWRNKCRDIYGGDQKLSQPD